MATRDVGNLRTRLSWEDEGATRSLKGFERDLKGLRSEMNLARSGGREYTNSLKGLRQQSDILTRRFRTQEERVKELRKRYEESKRVKGEDAEQTQNLENELRNATAQMNRTESQLERVNARIEEQINPWKRLGREMDDAGKKMQTIGRGMTDFGRNYSMRVTAPIVAGGAAVFKASMDFESAFAGVTKTVDGTEQELSSIRHEIREMAKEIPATTEQIAAVAETAGQLGIATENVTEFTKTMIDLGEATNMTSEQAATEFARFANIVGMSQDDFDKLGSVIVDLGNNLATTESEISEMALRLAGAGKQIGLSESQILAFSGALSSVGISAEAGGSAFSKVMVNMQLAAEKGGDSLKAFADVAGVSSSEFQKAYEEDATGAIMMFIEGLSTAEDRGLSAIGILDEMGITEVRMRDALLRAAGATDVFTEAIDLGSNAWEENTALTEEAAQRYETTESQLRIMWNRVKDVAISLGDALAPAIMDAIDAAEPFIQKLEDGAEAFSEMDEEQQRNILKLIALAAAIGPVSIGLGGITTTIGGLLRVGGGLSTMLGRAGGAGLIGRIGLLGMGGPVGLAVGGVGLLAGGIYALSQEKSNLHDVNYDVINDMQQEIELTDALIEEYENLENQNKLTKEETMRYMDILNELERTKSDEKIANLKDEQVKLEEQSGLTKDELQRFIDLNDEIIEKAPTTQQAISSEGEAYAENLDALKELNEEKRSQMKIEANNELRKALENETQLLRDQRDLTKEIQLTKADIGVANSDLIETAQLLKDEESELRDIQQEIKDLQNEKNGASEEELELIDLRIQQLQNEELEQLKLISNIETEKESIEATIDSLVNKLDAKQNDLEETQKEINQIEILQGQYEDLILSQVDITAEKGRGIEAIDKEIEKLQTVREELQKQKENGELNTTEYNNQVKELDDQLFKLESAKGELQNINELAGSDVYKDQNKDLDNQLLKYGRIELKAKDINDELKTDIDKDLNINTSPRISDLNADLRSPLRRTLTVEQVYQNANNPFGYAKGTDYHPGGQAFAGEEGPELAKLGNRWTSLDFGLYDLPRGTQVYTHDESKKILNSLNNIPGYASGISPTGEANRVANQLNNQPTENAQTINLLNRIAIAIEAGQSIQIEGKELMRATVKHFDEGLNNVGNRRQAAWGG